MTRMFRRSLPATAGRGFLLVVSRLLEVMALVPGAHGDVNKLRCFHALSRASLYTAAWCLKRLEKGKVRTSPLLGSPYQATFFVQCR